MSDSAPSRASGFRGIWLRGATSAALLGLIAYRTDWGAIGENFHKLSTGVIVLALAINLGAQVFLAIRWHLALLTLRVTAPFTTVLRCYWLGLFFNLFLPSSIGGDVARAYYLYRERRQPQLAGASSLLDRWAGLLALLLMAAIAARILPESSEIAWLRTWMPLALLGLRPRERRPDGTQQPTPPGARQGAAPCPRPRQAAPALAGSPQRERRASDRPEASVAAARCGRVHVPLLRLPHVHPRAARARPRASRSGPGARRLRPADGHPLHGPHHGETASACAKRSTSGCSRPPAGRRSPALTLSWVIFASVLLAGVPGFFLQLRSPAFRSDTAEAPRRVDGRLVDASLLPASSRAY